MISVIIPTYNEKDNVEKLVKEILKNIKAEIVIVDDASPDGTGRIADRLARRYNVRIPLNSRLSKDSYRNPSYNIRVLHRPGKLGLGSAIIEGFEAASGDIIGVMDADFSHPPRLLKKIAAAFDGGADVVLGSRYMHGGRIDNWPLKRKLASRVAVLMARPLTHAKDPVTGFFFVRKKIFDKINIKSGETKSWKVSLEILVRGKYKNLVEVPYTFVNRKAGKSKISAKEYKSYMAQIFSLLAFKVRRRFRGSWR